MFNGAITRTAEFDRIAALPRRQVDVGALESLADEMTALLKTPTGTMRLKIVQALALHDIGTLGGGLCAVEVGGGKTLTSLLAAYVLDAKRPILMLPGGLVQKTNNEWRELAKHWLIPSNVRLFSYDMLGRVQSATELEGYEPDLIICDEVQKLKNPDAAVTRRVARYMASHPDTRFVAMTGTIMRRSLHDFAHVLRWCLKGNAPIPATDHELDEWAAALDERVDELNRYEPGALLELATDAERRTLEPIAAARKGFQRRLRETPGVVTTIGDGERIDATLHVRAVEYDVQPVTEAHIAKLRSTMLTPDDWPLTQPVEVWRHARELSLGFHSIWSPRPPDAWREARRAWFAFVRDVLARSPHLDSPKAVEIACEAGLLPRGLLDRWLEIEPTYKINAVDVWHDDSALNAAADWMRRGPGIVWTEHVFFAERLSQMTGAPYYGESGLDPNGNFIDNGPSDKAIIASFRANREGRNLQLKWWRNLVVSPLDGADAWQQMVGRTHRTKQPSKRVEVDVFLGCIEHGRAFHRAMSSARTIRDTTGEHQKLLAARIDFPSQDDIEARVGARWDNMLGSAYIQDRDGTQSGPSWAA